MKQHDHLPAELRRKVNYLRNFRVEVSNDKPGGWLVFTVATAPHVSIGCGQVYTQENIDQAIAVAERSDPALTRELNIQLTLF